VEPLDIRQGGFRRMRGTLEQVACLHDAIRHWATFTKGKVQLAFLDIKAAYDSVHRPILWNAVRERGASQRLVSVLCALFEYNVSKVAIGDKETGEVDHVSGLLQGSILSPTLYSLFINELPERLARLGRPGQGDAPVSAFLYADDIALVGDDMAHLQSMLTVCETHAREMGYRFAPAKCVHLGALPGQTVYLYGTPLPKSDMFPYLGVPVGPKGIQYEAHGEHVAESFGKALQLFRTFGLHGNGLPLETCRHAFVTFLRPVLEYGLPLISNQKARARLQSCQNMALRFILSAPRSTSVAHMHHLLNVPLVDVRYEVLRAKWLRRAHAAAPSCLVFHALKEYGRKPIGASTLHHKQSSKLPRPSRYPEDFDKMLRDFVQDQHQVMLQNPTVPPLLTPPDTKPGGLLRALDGYVDRRATKVVSKWIVGRFGGEPVRCTRCSLHRATPRHMEQCTRVSVSVFITRRQWSQAADGIRLAASLCTAWQCKWNAAWEAPPSLRKKRRPGRPP
jgi:hypothetical protein